MKIETSKLRQRTVDGNDSRPGGGADSGPDGPSVAKILPALALVAYVAPLMANALAGAGHSPVPWRQAPLTPTGLAPDPATTPEAVVQVYGAPTFSWRGVFAIHTWIVVKPSGAPAYTRYEVIGWDPPPMIKVDWAAPDGLWYGKRPIVLLDRRGAGVDGVIERVHMAVGRYPYADRYVVWPGPNSNTFIAHIARSVPELGLDLPANAIGKDFRELSEAIGKAPSGTGVQVSLLGMLGVMAALREGIEINILGLNLGVDPVGRALRLPGIGRLPFDRFRRGASPYPVPADEAATGMTKVP
ncbi:MAG: DUF3750 domain-containing protein [Magnetospirillum sp.]|nr:DUF3750 domain-containing protein [Magnetospirillum sp.]